jgi:hypothetical protein
MRIRQRERLWVRPRRGGKGLKHRGHSEKKKRTGTEKLFWGWDGDDRGEEG